MSDRLAIFKHEGEDDTGSPIGPVRIVERADWENPTTIGVPYVPKCVCPKPNRRPGSLPATCANCDREIVMWVTLQEARALAAEHNIELRET